MKYYPPRFLFRRYEILRRVKGGDRFVEVGPGSLNLAVDLLDYFKRGTLIEFNPEVQQIYQKLKEPIRRRLDLIIADFSISTPLQAKYDCVVACEVMEHIENDEAFLRALYELLNERGQLILSVPSRMKLWSHSDEVAGHFRRYEKDDLLNTLSKYPLKKVQIISYGFPFVNIARWPRNLLAQIEYREKIKWSLAKRSQKSGVPGISGLFRLSGIICNKYTVYPFNLFASMFNDYDLSDGYLVVAEKAT